MSTDDFDASGTSAQDAHEFSTTSTDESHGLSSSSYSAALGHATPNLKPYKTSFDITFGSPSVDLTTHDKTPRAGSRIAGVPVWPLSPEKPLEYERLYPVLPLDDFPPRALPAHAHAYGDGKAQEEAADDVLMKEFEPDAAYVNVTTTTATAASSNPGTANAEAEAEDDEMGMGMPGVFHSGSSSTVPVPIAVPTPTTALRLKLQKIQTPGKVFARPKLGDDMFSPALATSSDDASDHNTTINERNREDEEKEKESTPVAIPRSPATLSLTASKSSIVPRSPGMRHLASPAKPSSNNSDLLTVPAPQPFVFGSPANAVSNKAFSGAAQSVLDEMNKRLAANGTKAVSSELLSDPAAFSLADFAAAGGMARSGSGDRFKDQHEGMFGKMDSIANHYAARRVANGNGAATGAGPVNKKRKSEVLLNDKPGGRGVGRAIAAGTGGQQKATTGQASTARVVSRGTRSSVMAAAAKHGLTEEGRGEDEADEDGRIGKRARVVSGDGGMDKGIRVSLATPSKSATERARDEKGKAATKRMLERRREQRRSRGSIGGSARECHHTTPVLVSSLRISDVLVTHFQRRSRIPTPASGS